MNHLDEDGPEVLGASRPIYAAFIRSWLFVCAHHEPVTEAPCLSVAL